MKKILIALAIAVISFSAAAGSDNKPFNVKVTLTSACKLSTITDVDFTYTSLQTGAQTATGGAFTVTCTKTLPYNLRFTNITGLTTASGTIPTVLLDYTLGLSAAGSTGNGLAQPFNVTGNMIAAQAGTCATGSCSGTDATQVLFVTY
ncbi:MAG: spore coat protein U domain-containing protein [Burkholderiaceae bacterium]|nr:spore coat protein U domain-containing protein [Burkholderiaceae bacterium]